MCKSAQSRPPLFMASSFGRWELERVHSNSRPVTPQDFPHDNDGIQTTHNDLTQSLEQDTSAQSAYYEFFNNVDYASRRGFQGFCGDEDCYDETPINEVEFENMSIRTVSNTEVTHTNSDGTKTTYNRRASTLPPGLCHNMSHDQVSDYLNGVRLKPGCSFETHKQTQRINGKSKKPRNHDSVEDVTATIVRRLRVLNCRDDLVKYLNKYLLDGANYFYEKHKEHQKVCDCKPCGLSKQMQQSEYAIVSYHLMFQTDEKQDDMRSLKQDIACHRALGNQMVKEHNLTNCSRMFKSSDGLFVRSLQVGIFAL